MANLIKTEEITENGVDYIVETYDSGAIVRTLKQEPLPDDYVAPEQPLTEEEQIKIETYLNSCFIADMMTLNM